MAKQDWIKSKRKSRFSTDFINPKIHEKIEIVSSGDNDITFFDVLDENFNKIESKMLTSKKEAIAEANKYMREH
jgi:hypothetical protein